VNLTYVSRFLCIEHKCEWDIDGFEGLKDVRITITITTKSAFNGIGIINSIVATETALWPWGI